MQFPEVEVKPEDSLFSATAKVVTAFEGIGSRLLPFEHLSSVLPAPSVCHFFQTSHGGRECVIIVMPTEWSEPLALTVLNILLNIRMDPDPPGAPPLFRFYCGHKVPPVLCGLFGDSASSDFECRAALVAQFGNDLAPAMAFQLAAVAKTLLSECCGVKTGFFDPDGDLRIAQAVTEWFAPEHFPEDASPLNAIVALGFLYGELLRGRNSVASRWVRLREGGPWPSLVFGSDPIQSSGPVELAHGIPQVVFNPIASVIKVYQSNEAGLLREASDSLTATLREKLPQLSP